MKFSLDENTARFILREGFILNEGVILIEADDHSADAIKVAAAISSKIDELITKIKDLSNKVQGENLSDWIKKLQDAAKDAEISLAVPENADDEKLKIYQKYLDILKQFDKEVLKPLDQNLPDSEKPDGFGDTVFDFENDIEDFAKILDPTNFDAETAEQEFSKFSESINIIQEKTGADFQKEAVQNVKTLEDSILKKLHAIKPIVNSMSKSLPAIDTKNETTEGRDRSINDFISTGSDVYKTIGPILGNISTSITGKTLENLIDQYKKLDSALDIFEQNKLISGPLNKAADEKAQQKAKKEKEKADKAFNNTVDWAKLYSECITKDDFDTFWDRYFTEEWGDKANAVNNFGKTFADDLREIGWDPITNPIIGFLKRPAVNKLIGNKIDQNVYITLHNALARGELTLRDFNPDLERNTYGNGNLIFNMNFYDKTLDEMENYLKAQGQLRDRGGNLPGELASEFNKNQEARKIILSNIVLENGNTANLTDAAVKSAIIRGNLRPVTTVRQILAKNIGASAEGERETASDQDIENCLERITDPGVAKKVLAYLYSVFSANNETEGDLRDLAKKITVTLESIHDSYAPNSAEVSKIRNALPLKNKNLSKVQRRLLLAGLAKTAGILKA